MTTPLPLAIFDIGSNAVRLTIYRAGATGKVEMVHKAVELCELGRLDPHTNALYPDGVTNAMKTIDRFCQMVRNPTFHISGVVAVGTEAIRRASDGGAFINRIKSEFGLDVHILSERDEGIYGARGVIQGIPNADGIVADLGGGSLQLTRVQNGQIGETFSMPMGTLRLLSAPPPVDDLITTPLSKRPAGLHAARTLYVMGGSWRSLAKLYQTRAGEKPGDVQGLSLNPNQLQKMVSWLTEKSRAEMTTVLTDDYHLEPKRAQGLGVAGTALAHVINALGVEEVIVSSAGIRDGLLRAVLDGTLIPGSVPKGQTRSDQTNAQ